MSYGDKKMVEGKKFIAKGIHYTAPIVAVEGTVDGQPAMWIGNVSQLTAIPVGLVPQEQHEDGGRKKLRPTLCQE